MAKKFFNDRVHNTKRTIIRFVIIGVCIIGIIVCFILTSKFNAESRQKEDKEISIKSNPIVEINTELDKSIFFANVKNVDLDTIDITYPEDFNIAEPGTYVIIITIDEKQYDSTLSVVDTTKPKLVAKDLTIKPGDKYEPASFVESCEDNSNNDCIIAFYEGIDEDGNIVDYGKYKDKGIYSIKISAKDPSGNETMEEIKLYIDDNKEEPEEKPQPIDTPKPVDCKYGDSTYDANEYLLASNVTTDGCAVSLDLYKDENITKDINNIMEVETTRIKKDIGLLKIMGNPTLNRKITAIINSSNSGIVGYELQMIVSVVNNGVSETVADYKIDVYGKRVFNVNPYNLAN